MGGMDGGDREGGPRAHMDGMRDGRHGRHGRHGRAGGLEEWSGRQGRHGRAGGLEGWSGRHGRHGRHWAGRRTGGIGPGPGPGPRCSHRGRRSPRSRSRSRTSGGRRRSRSRDRNRRHGRRSRSRGTATVRAAAPAAGTEEEEGGHGRRPQRGRTAWVGGGRLLLARTPAPDRAALSLTYLHFFWCVCAGSKIKRSGLLNSTPMSTHPDSHEPDKPSDPPP